ncbi:hypothetical protein SAMN04487951_10226 [Vreelandella arcis]|uniref:Uncharacterized protein n=1 Tax=Vreelandella arcis TaxID=416873 RepID=A0A1G9Y7U4_9GAMM|nr:hypothetical protein SAMN04487951_10226 [Halomonas arcis]
MARPAVQCFQGMFHIHEAEVAGPATQDLNQFFEHSSDVAPSATLEDSQIRCIRRCAPCLPHNQDAPGVPGAWVLLGSQFTESVSGSH